MPTLDEVAGQIVRYVKQRPACTWEEVAQAIGRTPALTKHIAKLRNIELQKPLPAIDCKHRLSYKGPVELEEVEYADEIIAFQEWVKAHDFNFRLGVALALRQFKAQIDNDQSTEWKLLPSLPQFGHFPPIRIAINPKPIEKKPQPKIPGSLPVEHRLVATTKDLNPECCALATRITDYIRRFPGVSAKLVMSEFEDLKKYSKGKSLNQFMKRFGSVPLIAIGQKSHTSYILNENNNKHPEPSTSTEEDKAETSQIPVSVIPQEASVA